MRGEEGKKESSTQTELLRGEQMMLCESVGVCKGLCEGRCKIPGCDGTLKVK